MTQMASQSIKLEGFNGLKTYTISTTKLDSNGAFELTFSKSDYGVGYLTAIGHNPILVILTDEDVEYKGETLGFPETLKIVKGQQNQWYGQYATEQPRREQALSAWSYLEKHYAFDPLFAAHDKPIVAIHDEIKRIKQEDSSFVHALPEDSYVRWFLPIRKLVSTVSIIAQQRQEEVPDAIQSFRNINYADPRLYKSGLFKEAIEAHFWLIENSGNPLDKVFDEMNRSIDIMMEKLVTNEKIFNELTDYLFDLLERHSLFTTSEYLALKVLNEVSCTVDNNLAKQLETYRAMKKGNTAPDINFNHSFFSNKNLGFSKLSDIKADYIVVVFGASWCPKCKEELPVIVKNYNKWKSNGVEVLFIALEEDENTFLQFTNTYPFPSYCDYKKWKGEIVNDYYVFATPTMFLLDKKREILLRPNSVKQMDAWVDWFLIEGNPIR
jgi:thiol-disulfide isomerase/thioredoxin